MLVFDMEPPQKKQEIKSKNIMFTDEEILQKQNFQKNKNTIKTEERVDRAFQKILEQCEETDI